MTISHLSTRDLAERWTVSRRTLDRWRWAGEGPRFLKLGGRVVYRIADIEAFEQQQLRTRTDSPANQCTGPHRSHRQADLRLQPASRGSGKTPR
jgi:predicted DNA-binding transcriptional regulator AlpA